MTATALTIGTRGSALAVAQTELIAAALVAQHPALQVNLVRITTTGDRILDQPLTDIGGKGLFVAEIEEALREGRIDLAVHSAKDLPTDLPEDLALAAIPARADARDVLVSRDGTTLDALPPGSRIGTSSPRRTCQIAARRPDLHAIAIRGNVDTRLRKLAQGEFDALVLAAAGLIRLGRTEAITEWLSPEVMLPAVGQGALALQVRAGDTATQALLEPLGDRNTAVAVSAERAFLRALGAGCSAAAGASARLDGDALRIEGLIGSADGRLVRGHGRGPVADAEALGTMLAMELLDRGGRRFLAEASGPG
ncbi:MAG TPA: hydroxymethylbilane synthase [Gemmatimonadales bacterium]|nr:hydroxymethylbilane synthase [Gemmatimonadales bacterium]